MPIDRRGLLAGATGALAALTAGVGARAANLHFLRIGSARPGGTYLPLADALAAALSAPPGAQPCEQGGSCGVAGLLASGVPSAGSRANVKGLAEGSLEVALCQADMATWLAKGGGPLHTVTKVDSLRAVAALGEEAVHLLVRSDAGIATPVDLRGKRVALGEEGSGSRGDGELVLAAFGLRAEEMQVADAAPLPALRHLLSGELDAVLLTGAAPLRQLSSHDATGVSDVAGKIRLLPLDAPELAPFLGQGAILTKTVLASGMYGIVPPEGLPTLATRTLLVSSARQTAASIAALTAALWSDGTKGRLADAGFSLPAPADAVRDLPVTLHAGAASYYGAQNLL